MELNLLKREDIPDNAITVSPSQMSMWYRCRYAWKLAKIDNVGKETYKTIGAQNKGLIFHAFLEWYYNASRGRAVGRLTEIEQMKALEYVQKIHGSDADLYKVFTVFIAYADWCAKNEEFIAIGAEVETFAYTHLISIDGRPIYLHGFIDLIAELFGKLIVADHKSHTNKPWTRSRLFYDHQFIFYALLLELQGIQVDGICVNTANLFIPKNEREFHTQFTINSKTKARVPRFDRIMLGPKDIKLQFYLEQFLANIKEMWCTPNPTYPMRLGADCEYCSFKEHIELDARGMGEGALVRLKSRHNTEDFELIDDEGDAA